MGIIPEPFETLRSQKTTSFQNPLTGKFFLNKPSGILRQLNQITQRRTVITQLFNRNPKIFRFQQACLRGRIRVSTNGNGRFYKRS